MENKMQPKLRFREFNNDWVQRKAKNLFIPVNERNREDLPVLSVTQDQGVVFRNDLAIDIKYDESTLSSYKVIHPGDFVISLRSFQGGFELSNVLGISSPAYTIFDFAVPAEQDKLYWKTIFKTFKFIESLKTVTFGIRDGKSISFKEFGDLKLNYPSDVDEQRRIGEFFAKLDETIAANQRKVHDLEQLKNAYLGRIFNQTLRFVNFTEPWEQRKLGSVLHIKGRIGFRGYTQADIVDEETGVLTFSPSNIMNNSVQTTGKNTFISVEKYQESPEIMVQNDDILFVKTGSTLGKSALVSGLEVDATINPQLVILKSNKSDAKFVATQLTTARLQKNISEVKIGGAIPTMTETEISKMILSLPSEQEQKAIGSLFEKIDNLISANQKKVDILTKQKSAYLQKLFI